MTNRLWVAPVALIGFLTTGFGIATCAQPAGEPAATTAYVDDQNLRRELNEAKGNYWETYIEELTGILGVRARKLSVADLEYPEKLKHLKTVIIGWQSGQRLSEKAIATVKLWVQEGGTLIGFGVRGLDEVFGISSGSTIEQQPDDFAISGCFDLRPHRITQPVHPIAYPEYRLPILSPVKLADLKGAHELGRLFDPAGRELGGVAAAWHSFGKGNAGYFAFDVAQTCWLMHQGRPAPHLKDVAGAAAWGKTADMQVLGPFSRKIPYSTEMVFLIQNMMTQRWAEEAPCAFVYQIPPKGDTVPDALLYWSGDEYTGPVRLSLEASDWMRAMGLPYHVNIVAHAHPMTADEYRHITEHNRHEVSVFYRLDAGNRFTMSPEVYQFQSDEFLKRFGKRPVSTLNNHTRWYGWAEAAEWMAAAGGMADNSFFGLGLVSSHPLHNGPKWGFGFGTGYPYFFYWDHTQGNKRVEFIEQPMYCYETGHRGSISPLPPEERKQGRAIDPCDVHAPIDMAIRHNLVVNMFYHPIYIVEFPRCREAIREIVRYIEYRKANVYHMGADAAARWWFARRNCSVIGVSAGLEGATYRCHCDYDGGMIVKMFLGGRTVSEAACDGRPAVYELREGFGGDWLFVVLPKGTHQLQITF